jgi:hypothetical protein
LEFHSVTAFEANDIVHEVVSKSLNASRANIYVRKREKMDFEMYRVSKKKHSDFIVQGVYNERHNFGDVFIIGIFFSDV